MNDDQEDGDFARSVCMTKDEWLKRLENQESINFYTKMLSTMKEDLKKTHEDEFCRIYEDAYIVKTYYKKGGTITTWKTKEQREKWLKDEKNKE
jgi:hypothetical protein